MTSNHEKLAVRSAWAIPTVLLLMFMLSYRLLLMKLFMRWNSGENSYCYLIVPLFIYLCIEKKNEFQFTQFSWNFLGYIAILFSILLMSIGELGSMETVLYIGIWGCMVGVMFVLYGNRLRYLTFPLFILGFMVPLPPFVIRMLTFNLKLAASSSSVIMMRLAGMSVLQDGNIIDFGIAQLQVVDACSGLRYFVPLVLMALLFGYFYCKKLWQKTALLIFVLPLSIIVNGFRIFSTGMLYIWGHAELAENFFHDFSGWVIFIFAGLVLFGFAMLLGRLGTPPAVKCITDRGGRPVNPLMAATMTIILSLVFASSGYALQILPSAAKLTPHESFNSFPMTIGKWNATRDYLDQEILENLWADDYISANYHNEDFTNAVHLLITFYDYQGTRHTCHTPQSCMLGSGWALIESRERIVPAYNRIKLPIMTSIWHKNDTCILSCYFFFQRGRVFTSPWMNKYWLMVDAFTRHRTDGALVRIELPLTPDQSLNEAYAILDEFVGDVFAVLPAFVPL
jgi:exosortase D (VPLPA-CTERM-specific)